MDQERWVLLKEFPRYEVSNLGHIANIQTDVILQPSRTRQGALKVGLYRGDPDPHTRSVKVLVAEAFVPGKSELFDTPIMLDGDQTNVKADNLLWRPRWFAWKYARQFKDIPNFYGLGPILDVETRYQYSDVVDAGTTFGLLFEDIWESLHLGTRVQPTGQVFAFASKV